MARIVLALIAFAAIVVTLKIVIAALFVAGLIFKPKATLGLLLLLGAWALFKAYPMVALGLGGLVGLAAMVGWFGKKEKPAEPEQLALPLSEPDGS